MTPHVGPWPRADVLPNDELVRQQGVRPIASVEDLAPAEDPFESDDEYAAFLNDLRTTRRAELRAR